MRDWFESLETRERIFVGAGSIVVVLALLYALLWAPLDKRHAQLQTSVAAWERSLADLQPLLGMQQADSRSSGPTRNAAQQTPVVIVDRTLRARGLDRSLQRSQPTTSNGIRVEFENAAFDDLVLWLGDLGNQYGMHVSQGTLSTASRAGPGRINATLTLERAP